MKHAAAYPHVHVAPTDQPARLEDLREPSSRERTPSSVEVYGNEGSYPANPPGWSTGCGTSLAAPMFAGIVALADQEARHTLGAINPALYKMAASHDPGIVDILRGDNSFRFPSNGKTYVVQGFHAHPGYDLISGIGTIDAARFVPELAKAAG